MDVRAFFDPAHISVDNVLKRIFSQNTLFHPNLTPYQSKYVSSLFRAISLGNCDSV